MLKPDNVTSIFEYRNADLIQLADHISEKSRSGELKGFAVIFDLGEWGHGTAVAGSYNVDSSEGILELMLLLNKVKKSKNTG